MTVMQDFFGRAAVAPERVVLVMAETGALHTAGEVAHSALRMAQWLHAQGLQAGDRFAVLLENRVEILALALADLQGSPADFQDRPLGRDLLYSSGTTGRPKGVLKPLWPAELRGQANPEAPGTARIMGMGEDTVYLSRRYATRCACSNSAGRPSSWSASTPKPPWH